MNEEIKDNEVVVDAKEIQRFKELADPKVLKPKHTWDPIREPYKYIIIEKSRTPTKNLEKAEVQPFSRIRGGHFERVRGWLLPEKYGVTYAPDARSVMAFIKDHVGLENYGKIIVNASKESTYKMEAVNSAYLDVANSAKGTLERMVRTDATGLKQFLVSLFDHISSDVLALCKDLRKSKR